VVEYLRGSYRVSERRVCRFAPVNRATFRYRRHGDPRTDGLTDGRSFRSLTVVDIYTRERLAIESEQKLKGEELAWVLKRIKAARGVPKMAYCDNGREFCSQAMAMDLWGGETNR
jgi:predicted GIY-YIG superfamily endonuclease